MILDLYADNRLVMSGADAGIVAGSCWQEAVAGTNGLGTALAAGQPVAVTALAHYFLSLGAVSCNAAPVRDAQGEVVGVLDASSCFESRQHHTQALVKLAATPIENGLLLHQQRAHWVLAIQPRAEFLGTLSAGLLVFDAQGRLLARNARGRHLLQGLEARQGVDFDCLFGEPFEHLPARLHKGGKLRLRDTLGSVLVVQCINRPPAPRLAGPARPADLGASLTDAAIARLEGHRWPGNFRKLRSVLTRALLASGSPHLALGDIDRQLPAAAPPARSALQQSATELVRRGYQRTGHSISQTSRNLGVSRTTVYRHLQDAPAG